MADKMNTVLYTGITRNLEKKVYEHKNKLIKGLAKKYPITKLVYYEIFGSPTNATKREKQIKKGSMENKMTFIKAINPKFDDLSLTWFS